MLTSDRFFFRMISHLLALSPINPSYWRPNSAAIAAIGDFKFFIGPTAKCAKQ